jgi:tetratricopeptide (TPR) repeat protein
MVWQTNVALLSNTVELNPKNRMLRYVYMDALLSAGNIVEAKKNYLAAASLPKAFFHNRYDDRGDLLIGAQFSREGSHGEALKIYENALVKSKYGSENLLVAALQEIEMLMPGVADKREQDRLEIMQADFSKRLQNMTSNPHRLIEFGKLAMQRGAFQESAQLFEKALKNMPSDDRLRTQVSTYLKKVSVR